MDENGQSALEYLLLIGGAVLIAVIVITLLLSLQSSGGNAAGQAVHRGTNIITSHLP